MLPRWVQVYLALFLQAWSARRDAQLQFLKLQVELLQGKLPGKRVILTPEDRARLIRAGGAMRHQVDDVIQIVGVKTYRRWLREEAAGRQAGRVGRPRKMTSSLRELIVRMANENQGWGVRRIVGELRKLALMPSRSSVRRVLVEEGVGNVAISQPGKPPPEPQVLPPDRIRRRQWLGGVHNHHYRKAA